MVLSPVIKLMGPRVCSVKRVSGNRLKASAIESWIRMSVVSVECIFFGFTVVFKAS